MHHYNPSSVYYFQHHILRKPYSQVTYPLGHNHCTHLAIMFAIDAADVPFDSLLQRGNLRAEDILITPSSPDSQPAMQEVYASISRKMEMASNIATTFAFEDNSEVAGDASKAPVIEEGTPPMAIPMTPNASRSKIRSRHGERFVPGGIVPLVPDHDARPSVPTGKHPRKKKKVQKRSAMEALTTVRGFTPATSGDEGSDFSTTSLLNRRNLSIHPSPSATSSPGLRSSSPSILSQQIEAMSLDTLSGKQSIKRNKSKLGSETPSSASISSGGTSDNEATDMISYEIPLEHDFISPDVCDNISDENGDIFMDNNVVRKMTASDFEPLRCLGKGSFGTVILVRQISTGKLYAQKQFKKASLIVRKQLVDQTKAERVILESINRHPFVVKLFYAFQDYEKLYLILEYAQGGELFTRMLTERMFPEETAAFYMAEMVLALEHLHHTVGVVYRDLKPENILLDSEGHLLLTDFGLSKVAVDGHHRCRSMTGTLEYMAPEVLLQQSYGTAVDWWSFGILGFDLLTGASPFRADCETKVKHKILKQKLTVPFFMSEDARDLLTRLLRKDPKKRLGACMPKDMGIIKKHRFFRKIDWKKLEARELEPPIKPLITNPELAENFSAEFTDLALSPVVSDMPRPGWDGDSMDSDTDPFGGFSFVASRSLLESGNRF